MAPIRPVGQKPTLGNILVIGGCGFLGHHIVAQIIENWGASKISVIDVRTDRYRRPDSDKVSYYEGDITKVESLLDIFTKAKPDIVIHTASPLAVADASQKTKNLYYKVNVEGTKAVIQACQEKGVKVLVYTSSASVVSDNVSDLINVDERWPVVPPQFQTEYYSQTKVCYTCFPSHIRLVLT
jgi:sterol-4alpha-carboxylate 3-dehydrogenase (decarboxylating)